MNIEQWNAFLPVDADVCHSGIDRLIVPHSLLFNGELNFGRKHFIGGGAHSAH